MSKILIVDDEIISTIILGDVLAEAGHEIKTALNGADGVEIGTVFKPDLVISDWKLKDNIDGCQLARILQNLDPSLKVILFSGSSSIELAEESKDIKVHSIIEKPCDIDEMVSRVVEALRPAG